MFVSCCSLMFYVWRECVMNVCVWGRTGNERRELCVKGWGKGNCGKKYAEWGMRMPAGD